MLCPNCHKEIENNRYICPHCGSLVSSSELAMPILETPIYIDDKQTANKEVQSLTIDANPSDYHEKRSSSLLDEEPDSMFQDVKPNLQTKEDGTFVDDSYTFDYKGVIKETEKSHQDLNSQIVAEPAVSTQFSKPYVPTKEELLAPFVTTTQPLDKKTDDLSLNKKENQDVKKENVIPTFSYNEMPISDKFLYDRKRNDEVKEEVVSLNQQTIGTPPDSSINEPIPNVEKPLETPNQESKEDHFLIEQALKKPVVEVKMPEHPRGKLPEQVTVERKKFRWLLVLAIILLLIAGSVFSYYVFLSTKSPTQYRLKDEIVPAITTIVGNRSVKDAKVESNETEIKRVYHYINISNVTADLTNYISYLQESLKYINITPYDLTESSGTIQLGNESKTNGYVILMTITYDTNSYTITIERKQGTLTRY